MQKSILSENLRSKCTYWHTLEFYDYTFIYIYCTGYKMHLTTRVFNTGPKYPTEISKMLAGVDSRFGTHVVLGSVTVYANCKHGDP